jgi:endonuclease/exonuclease/phosphatase (EEP) superfamily protein YafD
MKIRSIPFWVNLVAAPIAIATILAFASRRWWVLAMLEHPRPQYALILAIALAVGLLVPKSWKAKSWGLVWLIPLIINLWLIYPVFIAPSPINSANSSFNLRLLHATLDRTNPKQIDEAIEYLDKQQVDLISLIEVTPEYLQQVQLKLTKYQIIAAEPRKNTHGSVWLASVNLPSEIELKDSDIIHLPATNDRPLLTINLSVKGKEVILVCYQAIRPRDRGTVVYQKVEFAALGRWSRKIWQSDNQELVVIGDYNSTPWYGSFREMLADSGLINSQSGFGLQPTWHASFPTILQVAIDHCLHSPGLRTVRRYSGANMGSDHLPLFVELNYTGG